MANETDVRVLLCTEGTYPFVGGGVSVWCHTLCTALPQVAYTLWAITGNPYVTPRYELPPNVRRLVHIPLWEMLEPAEYIQPDMLMREIYLRRQATTDEVIEAEFVPLLRCFLRGMQAPYADSEGYGEVIHRLWRYFQTYDWNTTWKSRQAWNAFVEEVLHPYKERAEEFLPFEQPNVFDLTTAMRWMYYFLMPLNAPVPETDIVHATIAGFAGLAGIIAKYEYGTPFLITEHGVFIRERYIAISEAPFTPFAKRFLLNMTALISRLCYRHADMIAPVANFNRRWEIRYGADPAKIETIYNGIDPDVFRPKPKPPKTAHRPTVVAAARVMPIKDIETMIRAAAVARESIPDVHFIVYGSLNADQDYVERCRRLIAELNLENTFEFGGFHSRPSEIYTEGDISVLSSISEGFPYTVLESMACARPVVATDVGGVREALEGFGIVVPPRDPEALGEGVVKLLRDDTLRLELGRKAREQVLLKFRVSQAVENYRQLYQRLVARSNQGVAVETAPTLAKPACMGSSAQADFAMVATSSIRRVEKANHSPLR